MPNLSDILTDLPDYGDWRPTSFDSRGLGLPDRQTWKVLPVIQTRDSGVLERSNFRTAVASRPSLHPGFRRRFGVGAVPSHHHVGVTAMPSEMIQCPRCWGRGYQPEARRNGGPGFYARNCPRCNGRGEVETPPPRTSVANDIHRGTLPDGYELTAQDIGRPLCPREGFGRVLRADVGKRCYLRGGIFQMENAAQRDARRPIQDGDDC